MVYFIWLLVVLNRTKNGMESFIKYIWEGPAEKSLKVMRALFEQFNPLLRRIMYFLKLQIKWKLIHLPSVYSLTHMSA